MDRRATVLAFNDPSAYVLHIAHSPDGASFAAAGAKPDGKPLLSILDTATLKTLGSLTHHTGPISDLCFVGTTLLSSSMDGTVAVWDLRSGQLASKLSRPALEPEEPTQRKKKKGDPGLPSICTVDSDQASLIAYGTSVPEGSEDSMIVLFDNRNMEQPLATFADSHSDDITCVRFRSGLQSSTAAARELATGGTDGVLNLFHLTEDVGSEGKSDEDKENDSIQMTIPLDSISRFAWAGKYVCGLTTTEQLFVVDPNEGDVLLNLEDVRSRTLSEYLVDCVFDAATERLYLYAGVGGDVACYHINLDGVVACPERNLLGGHSDIVRGFSTLLGSDGRSTAVLTGGEDGRVILWV
jgi:WD40 repeat protein